jgi:Domain of unknown function (DUF4214)
MKRNAVLTLVLLTVLCLLSVLSFAPASSALGERNDRHSNSAASDGDADLPARFKNSPVDRETYLRLRAEHVGRLRGLTPGAVIDPGRRGRAIQQMERQEEALKQASRKTGDLFHINSGPTWTELGPKPLPNGQTQQSPATTPVSGRVTTVAVDPTNSNKVYLGTAQGGVWRSTNGGSTWTTIFDSAQSLAVGALALAPSDPTILYVGTGEANGSIDSFFGVGVYRIDNADTTATLVGPINPTYSAGLGTPTTCFAGRGVKQILVHPTDPATIFVSTTGALSGISGLTLGNQVPPLGLRGLYRSTNATAAAGAVTFQKLTVSDDNSFDSPGTGNTAVWDIALEPGNPNNLLATVAGTNLPGGIFRSTNALAANPTFTQTFSLSLAEGVAIRLAMNTNPVGPVVTVYAASNEPSSDVACSGAGEKGRVRKSTDGGATWSAPLPAAEGYCGGQCIYDDPIAVDPNDANVVYLGGNARGTCSDVMKKSTDGGATFTRDDTGLHADGHALFIDPLTTPHTVWFGNDGGIWKRLDAAAGTAWINENNAPLGTIQFQSVAVHPTDTNFTIGGTQDNGTEAQQTTPGNWTSAEGGDGGFALIDQSATNTTNVTMYSTFFNLQNNLIGLIRTNLGACLAVKDSWEFRGAGIAPDASPSCDGSAFVATNGLNIADNVNFYAPMALGPGTPNKLYFGTDKLYRSNDKGDTMTIVSQDPLSGGTPVSAIGIAPGNDNVRLVGMNSGKVFATITGSSTLTDISPTLPDNPNRDSTTTKYVSRAVIDPNDPNTAYLTLSYYTPAGQGVFRTTNLNLTGTGTVTWSAAGNGIPSIPINAFAIDPAKSSRLFAGTDIGVYISEDAGANWSPYGSGLPRVAVFDLAIQPTSRTLRIATHGRGMWEIPIATATAAPAKISGRILTNDGAPLAGAVVNLSGPNSAIAITDGDGNYHFDNLETDSFYTVTPVLVNYHFNPANRSFSLLGNKTDAVFTATADAVPLANPLDTAEYFVRQQYVDILAREPDQGGFNYWSAQINACSGDVACIRSRRIDVAAAFFVEQEFQQTGSFIYDVYSGALGRRPAFAEYSADRPQLIGGADLDIEKSAFAESFVQRTEFAQKYQQQTTAELFVDALIQNVRQSAGVDLSSRRDNLVAAYNNGGNMVQSRALVVRALADDAMFSQSQYNAAFVLTEYFGYLRRDPDAGGYQFWLNVLNNGEPGNYRGMVCAFITSAEYQRRFSPVTTHTNAECGG